MENIGTLEFLLSFEKYAMSMLSDCNSFIINTWEPINAIAVLGRSCDLEKSLYVSRCKINSVAIIRRSGGGGTVLLDKGMLIISIAAVINFSLNPRLWFNKINGILSAALKSKHVNNISHKGISDLCIGERKILGASLRLRKKKLLYQGSLLVNCDLKRITKYVKHPQREPDYRSGRSHEDFLTTLNKEGYELSLEDLSASIEDYFNEQWYEK